MPCFEQFLSTQAPDTVGLDRRRPCERQDRADYKVVKRNVEVIGPERLLTIDEVADLLRVSVKTIRNHRVHGFGPAVTKWDGRLGLSPSVVAQWQAENLEARDSFCCRHNQSVARGERGHRRPR